MLQQLKFLSLIAVSLALSASSASAQCSGQPGSGRVCGNPAASTGLPSWATQSSLLDRAFGSTPGTILNRGSSLWAETANPILGANGGASGSVTLNGSATGSVVIGVKAAAGSTIFNLPVGNGTSGFTLITDGVGNTSWASAGSGTVTSVGLSLPGIFSVSGSPVVNTGTLTATLAVQSANLIWAGPTTGVASTPTFRALVGADLPNPGASSLGGIQSFAAVGSQWIRQISTSGVPTASQPAFSDISGSITPAQCPNPSASTIGCIQSFALQANKWISSISTSGVPSATQPSFTDISGNITLLQFPSISNNTVLGNNSGLTAIPSALTATNILDFIATTQGDILYRNGSIWTALPPGTSGQVLSSGGAAANPSWATVTGTGTVTSVATNNGITGGTITTAGTIGLATIATGNALAYTGAGSGVPVATTPSALLDVIGSATGDILYRSSGSGWQVLAPGTNGQVLTQGASTPSWANAGTVSSVANSDGSLTISPTTGNVVASLATTIVPQHNFSNPYFNGGASAGTGAAPYYLNYVDCVRPEQYGATRDAVTNDTSAMIQALNAALIAKLGVCLQSGLRYQITPIQLGGTQLATGGVTGSISGTTLTVTAVATPLQITLGTVISGGTCSANTFVTAIGTTALGVGASGFIGTYTVNNSQTCTPTTITPTSITASFSGTTATVTVNSGKINLYDAPVFVGVTVGQTFVAQTSGTTGLSGTYTLAYAETVSSTAMLMYPYSIASLPKAFKGFTAGSQVDTQIGLFGGSAVNAAVLKIVDPPAIGANLGLDIGNFRVQPFGFAANCMMVHGLSETSAGGIPLIHDIDCGTTAAVGKNCAFNFVGNAPGGPSYGIVSAALDRLSSNSASVCDFNFDGNDGSGGFNIQGVRVNQLSGNSSSTGAGYYFDYTNLDAGTIISQDHTGAGFVWGHTSYFTATSIYDEANGAASSCTSNTHGLTLRGQLITGLGSACLNDQSGDISVFNGTVWLRNKGRQQGSLNTFASYPACAAGTEGSLVSITDSTTNTTGATIAGGSSNHVLGYCNGSNYVVVAH